jgi:hypothetical protein
MKLPTEVMRGQATHRRTECDYLGVLLDMVSLEEWQAVVSNALAAAKAGDAAARHWLGTFLLGRPAHPAPSPLTVVVGRLMGEDLVVEALARPLFNQAQYPLLYQEEAAKARIRDQVAAQLAQQFAPLTQNMPPALGQDAGPGPA